MAPMKRNPARLLVRLDGVEVEKLVRRYFNFKLGAQYLECSDERLTVGVELRRGQIQGG